MGHVVVVDDDSENSRGQLRIDLLVLLDPDGAVALIGDHILEELLGARGYPMGTASLARMQ